MSKKAVVILSGGMDSTLCAYKAKREGFNLITLHFNYGQRTEKRELKAFREISKELKAIKRVELNLDFLKMLGGSSLIDKEQKIPTEGLTKEIPSTYVPFRNGIFISIATALAEINRAEAIYIGVVEEDSSGYPDCREEYIKSMNKSINLGTKPTTKIEIVTPLINLKKEDIVKEAIKESVPLELTWSCYQNEEIACGVCDSCRLRLKGFKKAGVKDLIPYCIEK